MTAKEYLRQVAYLDKEVEAIRDQVDTLRALAEGLSTPLPGDKVKGGHSAGMDEIISDILELRQDMYVKIAECNKAKRKAIEKINGIEDARYRSVLERRYINMDSWEKIAVELGYTYQHVLKLHGQALRLIKVDSSG